MKNIKTDFGVSVEGVRNEQAAIASAVAASACLYWPAGVYLVDGDITPPEGAVWVSDEDAVILRAPASVCPSLVNVVNRFRARGIRFSGNAGASATFADLVLVTSSDSAFEHCGFVESTGNGLVYRQLDTGGARHRVTYCDISDNAGDGLLANAVTNLVASGNRARRNGGAGMQLNNYATPGQMRIDAVALTGNDCQSNTVGICVGNAMQNNTPEAPVYGYLTPESTAILIESNQCSDNASHGIVAQGVDLVVHGNVCRRNGLAVASSSGILVNALRASVRANLVVDGYGFGIDAGGSQQTDISGNTVIGNANTGINCGGTVDTRVDGNTIANNGGGSGAQVMALCMESDGEGVPFPTRCTGLVVANNTIICTGARFGVVLRDGVVRAQVRGNAFDGPDPERYLIGIAAELDVGGNTLGAGLALNYSPDASGAMTIPDIAEWVWTDTPNAVRSLMYASARNVVGPTGIAWVRVTAGGSGYRRAFPVTFSGGGGQGAQGVALVDAYGAVAGVVMTAHGSGYVTTPTPVFSGGGGSGAQAVAQIGVPLMPGRDLTVYANQAHTILRAATPVVESKAANNIYLAARDSVRLKSFWGRWNVIGRGA